jgi:hypothetical protein
MSLFLLVITYPSGDVHVETFPTACDRGFAMIRLARAPVVLRIADV